MGFPNPKGDGMPVTQKKVYDRELYLKDSLSWCQESDQKLKFSFRSQAFTLGKSDS